ncbi:MAG: AbrB/MazE/SpoVT family DNA-binding domain-containing protein [Candidatus Nitrosocosmicus sp.]|nr:AbrB/MazE/SpoVT family DNA-binding domain-containing protein [Candidatus Nitrosocosmicus sp.]MDN5868344.1 AbrB/MazE/SpoVT family DNA-binding domain-containing protein [Candidatus Nitrosocosmicus sp.]
MGQTIHKINGRDDKATVNVVLPITFIKELQIQKGDFVVINKEDDKIIIKKLEV